MSNINEDRKTDPKYWTQFDETIESLHIEKLVLLNCKTEEERIKNLISTAVTKNAYVAFMWYDVYHFFKTGYSAQLEIFETDSFEILLKQSKNYNGETNLCILEIKDININNITAFEKIIKQVGLLAIVVNPELLHKYRFNFLYKDK